MADTTVFFSYNLFTVFIIASFVAFWISYRYNNAIIGFFSAFGIITTAIYTWTTSLAGIPYFLRISFSITLFGFGIFVLMKCSDAIIHDTWGDI